MRPQKARNILNLAFKKGGFYRYATNTLDGLDQLKHFKTQQAKSSLNKLLEKAMRHEKIDTPVSYYPTDEAGRNIANMTYISNRYNCVGRLQFLKEVLEKY